MIDVEGFESGNRLTLKEIAAQERGGLLHLRRRRLTIRYLASASSRSTTTFLFWSF